MMKPLVGAILGVVATNAAAPDSSTPEAFKQTLLNAKSIVMIDPARGTSGKHLAEVYARCDNALHPPTVFWPAVS